MPKCYIAGPMRNLPLLNFPAFDRAARLGRASGWAVINPAEMDRNAGVQDNVDFVDSPYTARVFAGRDTAALLNMRAEDGDAIALLPGWQRSTGAKAELALANWVGLRVLSALTFRDMRTELKGSTLSESEPAEFQACGCGCGCGPDVERAMETGSELPKLEFGSCESGMCGLSKDLETAALCVVADQIANDPNF